MLDAVKAKVDVNPKRRRTGEKAAANLGMQPDAVPEGGSGSG